MSTELKLIFDIGGWILAIISISIGLFLKGLEWQGKITVKGNIALVVIASIFFLIAVITLIMACLDTSRFLLYLVPMLAVIGIAIRLLLQGLGSCVQNIKFLGEWSVGLAIVFLVIGIILLVPFTLTIVKQ